MLARSSRDDGTTVSDHEIVESILYPSKSILDPYRSSVVRTEEGEILTGMVRDRSEVELRLVAANGESRTLRLSDIESMELSKTSLMPEGLTQNLPDERSFVDLIRYLIDIRDGGTERARELAPALSMLAATVPDYESTIDHAGILRSWNQDSFHRGEAIYQRVCANCHGTQSQLGSLPTAVRFAEGKFKNGSDPWSMYRTLTHGVGFMPAQTWMVPTQKYDVIHYIQEAYLRSNPQVSIAEINENYLASLPQGTSLGPEPSSIEAWNAMDYGNALAHCYEVPGPRLNIAYKGIAFRVDSGPGGIARGHQWMLFDTDTLRWAAGWSHSEERSKERFIDWRDIQFNGEHGIHPRIAGDTVFANSVGPGWSEPATGSLEDRSRTLGRDGRRYGPLPKSWGRFRGLHVDGERFLVDYLIGSTSVLESPMLLASSDANTPILGRAIQIAPHRETLELRVADLMAADRDAHADGNLASPVLEFDGWSAGLEGDIQGLTWRLGTDQLTVEVPPRDEPRRFVVWCARAGADSVAGRGKAFIGSDEIDLASHLGGGPSKWPERLETRPGPPRVASEFEIDTLAWPDTNPWLAQMRFTGLDFFSDGSLALCTWDGDVWRVREDAARGILNWQRVASGLYQPLGIVVHEDTIYLSCRDQIAILRDHNGDGETDFYECFNNDHQVTEHFHEFAMGLQRDETGALYYAKSGRHALEAVVPQHGTLLRVTPDGESTEIIATGFRAANGVCLNPDGSFIVTDQEGFWNPKNRINWVTRSLDGPPKFYGNMFGYHDVTDSSDSAMEPPLCWITNAFDRSPAELMWIQDSTWNELDGGLLNFSYGYGKVYWVLHEQVDGVRQGGMVPLPIPHFPTGVMRGRMHPKNHALYTCGMFSWAGNATAPGGLYRIRKTDRTTLLPIQLSARRDGLHLEFAQPIQRDSVTPNRVHVLAWDLKRTARYGSDHYNERALPVRRVELSRDGRSVRIDVEGLGPTWGMEIRYDFQAENGDACSGVIHNTIHVLRDP